MTSFRVGTRLEIVGHFVRLDARRIVVEHDFQGVGAGRLNVRFLRMSGQTVVVGYQQEQVIFILEPGPVLKRADVVADVQLPGRPVAG
jgi:hypothetical protein